MRTVTRLLVLLAFLMPPFAFAGPAVPAAGFDGFPASPSNAPYFGEGGWLVFHLPLLGDLLYGCPSLGAQVPKCRAVPLPIRGPAAALEPWFIDPDTGSAWFKVSAAPLGEFLLACFQPRTEPYCTLVEIEERPNLATLSKLGPTASEGPALPVPLARSSERPTPLGGCGHEQMDACNSATFWMVAEVGGTGPVGLYDCGGLDLEPRCRLAISGFDYIDAAPFGIEKLAQEESGEGIVVQSLSSGSTAARAGLQEGDVIVSVAGFKLLGPTHLKGLLAQVPIGGAVRLEVRERGLIKLVRERR